MDKTVPKAAAYLLNWIASIELKGLKSQSRESYDVIYGNRQKNLPQLRSKPISKRSVDDWVTTMPWWGGKSSASGRYQFMKYTLGGLKTELKLRGAQIMNPNLQDRLGYHLLRRRGYDKWSTNTMPDNEFAYHLAKEWASLPVLNRAKGSRGMINRGQSYYAGDGLNKSLTKPEQFEAALREARLAALAPVVATTEVEEPVPVTPEDDLSPFPLPEPPPDVIVDEGPNKDWEEFKVKFMEDSAPVMDAVTKKGLAGLRWLNPEQVMAFLRTCAQGAGVYLAQKGFTTGSDYEFWSGIAVFVAFLAWGMWARKDTNLLSSASKVPDTEAVIVKSPEVAASVPEANVTTAANSEVVMALSSQVGRPAGEIA
jgi:muramidase (phage lysozyme)